MNRRTFLAGLACLSCCARARASSEPLLALDAEFRRGTYPGVDGMVVLQQGETLFSAAYPVRQPTLEGEPGVYNYTDPEWHPVRGGVHTLQSITKTVLSALVGIALERGELRSVEMSVADYCPEARVDLSLQDLLTMRAGIAWEEEQDWPAMEKSADWLAYVLAKGRDEKRFNYSSGVPMLLASLLTRATGQRLADYARVHLFEPLGIENFLWKNTPTGLADAQGGLYLSTADLARFGCHYLRKDSWVHESFRPRARDEDWRYGYLWWLLPHPAIAGEWVPTALGYGGQRLFLLPRQQLVAAFTGWNPGGQNSLPFEKVLRILTEVGS